MLLLSRIAPAVVLLLSSGLAASSTQAQTLPITVDRSAGGMQPFVTVAPNGAPVIQIAPPSGAGVSSNHYQQFNVGPTGVVFNNSGAPIGSVLAGPLNGNPMLGNGSASVILNQVTGADPSQLLGLMEIAGRRADLIIANPAGITCNGCGFVNAQRGVLTTGRAMIGPDGALQGFDVARGRIGIEGEGLHGADIDRVSLMARAVQLNAALHARRLDAVVGAAQVDYASGAVTPRPGEGEAPRYALDVAYLGGMYANSIFLIGGEKGLGVNLEGGLTGFESLHLDAAGNLTITPLAAIYGGNVTLRASGTLAMPAQVRADLSGLLDPAAGGAASKGAQAGLPALDPVRHALRAAPGTLQAEDTLSVSAPTIVNANRTLGGKLDTVVTADLLDHQGGILQAGRHLSLNVAQLSGNGQLQTGEDLSLAIRGSHEHTRLLTAPGKLDLRVAGYLNNRGFLTAGKQLHLSAHSMTNFAGAEIVSGDATTVEVATDMDNHGHIDGFKTLVKTGGRLNNFGAMYGDALGVQADHLFNPSSGTLVGRDTLDIGARVIENLHNRNVYAGRRLAVGRHLDPHGQAAGVADRLVNHGSTIESGGSIQVRALAIDNINAGFQDGHWTQDAGEHTFYRLDGSAQELDANAYWLCDATTKDCSKDPNWLGDDPERRLLMPSGQYPESVFGPPFDYAPGGRGFAGQTAPLHMAFDSGELGCADPPCGPKQYFYEADSPIWDKFGIERPIKGSKYHDIRYYELNRAIGRFNRDFLDRLVTDFTIVKRREWVTHPSTVATDPSQILAAGPITLEGRVLNDKSRILAGGALNVYGPAIENRGAVGLRVVEHAGTNRYTWAGRRQRKYAEAPFHYVASSTPVQLETATAAGHQAVHGRGAHTIPALARAHLPESTLFERTTDPNAPHAIRTNPRVLGGREYLSSDYLIALLARGAAMSHLPATAGDAAVAAWQAWQDEQDRIAAAALQAEEAARRAAQAAAYEEANRRALAALQAASGGAGGATGAAGAAGSAGIAGIAGAVGNTDAAGAARAGGAGGAAGTAGAPASSLAAFGHAWPRGVAMPALVMAQFPHLHTLRRLADGFYEQKLVADQIIQATGRRFLGGHTNDHTQYRALMQAAARQAGEHGLVLGQPLSPAQQQALKQDIVWLERQTTTAADGTTRDELVPRVYLAVRAGDLREDGTLMAGRTTTLRAEGDVTNTGTLAAREAIVVLADNVRNQPGGLIHADTVDLNARQDIESIAARIKGGHVTVHAARDVKLATITEARTVRFGNTTGPNWAGGSGDARAAHSSSTYRAGTAEIEADTLHVTAGRDISLQAASIKTTGDVALHAGQDVTFTTIEERQEQSIDWKKRNNTQVQRSKETGADIAAGGDIRITAGRDVSARGANAVADGRVTLDAGRDITLDPSTETTHARDEHYQKIRGRWSSRTRHTIDESRSTIANPSTFTGDSVAFTAARDVTIKGSNVGAVQNLDITAGNNAVIEAAPNTYAESHYEKRTRSGWRGGGGFGWGREQLTLQNDRDALQHSPSTVGSVKGDVSIVAGNALSATGSNLIAREGSVDLTGRTVTLDAAIDTHQSSQIHQHSRSGVTLSASTPMDGAIQTMQQLYRASSKVDNPVMQALGVAAGGLVIANTAESAVRNVKDGGAFSINLDIGTSKSESHHSHEETIPVGSTVKAGTDVRVAARGAGPDSDIDMTGAQIFAGRNVTIDADGDIRLQAAAQTRQRHSEHSQSSASTGVGVTFGITGDTFGLGFTAQTSLAASRGNVDATATRWHETRVNAGQMLRTQSGGDTELRGATARGERVHSVVHGDLILQSLQDTSHYTSQNSSLSAAATGCYGYCTSSWNVGGGAGRMQSSYESVQEQTGIHAADGGFQIQVAGNTALEGAVIASSDLAAERGLNALDTGTLSVKDIDNQANYEAWQVSGSVGEGSAGKNTGQKDQKPGSMGGLLIPVAAKDSAGSTTASAISSGRITIRDHAAQVAMGGADVATALASLNRSPQSSHATLDPIFDAEKVQASFDIVTTAAGQASVFMANRAQDIDRLDRESNDPSRTAKERAQAGADARRMKELWGPGGSARQVMTAVLAASSANAAAGTTQLAQSAAIYCLQSRAAEQIKEMSALLGGEGSPGHTALHAVLACGGATATGGSCTAAALGASASVVLNELLDDVTSINPPTMSAEAKETRLNYVAGMVTAITAAIDPTAAPTANAAARIEAENNALAVLPIVAPWLVDAAAALGTGAATFVLDKFNRESAKASGGATPLASLMDLSAPEVLITPNGLQPPQQPIGTPIEQDIDTELPGFTDLVHGEVTLPGLRSHESVAPSVLINPALPAAGPSLLLNESAGGSVQSRALQQAEQIFSARSPGRLTIGSKVLVELPNRGNAAIFDGATDAEVKQYFLELAGAARMPEPRLIPGRGRIFVVETLYGNFSLRDFASTMRRTPIWTIDIPGEAVGKTYNPEIKFLRQR
jgi:filamentous hemagglutinin